MHTKDRAALRTGPFYIFIYDEIIDANFFYAAQIADYTCSILGAVAFIQVLHAWARKFSALVTKLQFPGYHLFAVLNLAGYA
jgi:hypothetical protein